MNTLITLLRKLMKNILQSIEKLACSIEPPGVSLTAIPVRVNRIRKNRR